MLSSERPFDPAVDIVMAQITIYLPDEIESKAREAAKAK